MSCAHVYRSCIPASVCPVSVSIQPVCALRPSDGQEVSSWVVHVPITYRGQGRSSSLLCLPLPPRLAAQPYPCVGTEHPAAKRGWVRVIRNCRGPVCTPWHWPRFVPSKSIPPALHVSQDARLRNFLYHCPKLDNASHSIPAAPQSRFPKRSSSTARDLPVNRSREAAREICKRRALHR